MNINDIRQELALINDVTPLEGQRYATCLHTYEAASNQRELILGWFADDVIPQLSTDSASLLSVGCGAGDLDVKILSAGREHASAISYVGLEPDSRQCERFLNRMNFENDQNIEVEAHNTCFESYKERRRFDLVLMVHSLYYMEDPERALEDALNLVNTGGRLVILIASNDTLNELSSSFWEMENSGSTWFSEDLNRHLKNLDVTFERKRIEATLDITSCCEPDSEQGIRIADFLAQVPTGELPLRLRSMIFSYIEATSHRDGDMRWLPHNVDAFIIQSAPA
ncbi:MAG: class I SAM-dependent methyltransferase [Gammaproteobacteria bacterium]|nr:class I SAM-dependent methyltransferase [Gammaproteobacteria bacterium]